MVTFGSGDYQYAPVEGFFKRPQGWTFVEAADVAVDEEDNVYVLNRGAYAAVMIFDKDGLYLDGWGKIGGRPEAGIDFLIPHGISLGPEGSIYTSDTGDHTVRRWTKEGKLLLTIGTPMNSAPEQSGKPFNRPTHLTVASNGDFYASDGYGNSHIHCFDAGVAVVRRDTCTYVTRGFQKWASVSISDRFVCFVLTLARGSGDDRYSYRTVEEENHWRDRDPLLLTVQKQQSLGWHHHQQASVFLRSHNLWV